MNFFSEKSPLIFHQNVERVNHTDEDASSESSKMDASAENVTGPTETQLMTEIRWPRGPFASIPTLSEDKSSSSSGRIWKALPKGLSAEQTPFYRQQHPKLPRDPEQAVSILQTQLDRQTSELQDLQGAFNRLFEIKDSIKKSEVRLEAENKNLAASNSRTQQILQQTKEERDSLQNQIVELKQGLSSIGRAEGQVSDDVLNEEARNLAHKIQNWVAKNTRKLQLVHNTSKLSPKTTKALAKATLEPYRATSFSKLHIFQAIIACKIMAIFDAETLVFTEAEQSATTLCERIQAINTDPSRYNQWRALTYTLLYNISDAQLEHLTKAPARKTAENVEDVFCELLNIPRDEERIESLSRVLFVAIKLSRTLRTQRACIQFKMPTVGKFNPNLMQNEHGHEAADMAGEKIAHILFPILVKYGNDRGENTKSESVISKGRAICVKDIEVNNDDDDLEEAT